MRIRCGSRARGLCMKKFFWLIGLEKIEFARVLRCGVAAGVITKSAVPITEVEMNALRLLLKEELQTQLQPFRAQVNKRSDEVATQMDGLYRRDERREQEYLSIREQIRRLEAGRLSEFLNACLYLQTILTFMLFSYQPRHSRLQPKNCQASGNHVARDRRPKYRNP